MHLVDGDLVKGHQRVLRPPVDEGAERQGRRQEVRGEGQGSVAGSEEGSEKEGPQVVPGEQCMGVKEPEKKV